MQQVSCPGCGAPVEFKSAASVMAVCAYCKTTVLKDAASVKDLGKMSEVLEDYSPIQIGTSGVFEGRSFAVVGRIQLRYSDGFWNEWYVLFDDTTAGWLADASGQFTFTFEKPSTASLPEFAQIRPGLNLGLAGETYTASDVRSARCTAGQGELPVTVGPGWEAKVADFRSGARFMTLDYSDGPGAKVYVGRSVTLGDLKAQLLRDEATIESSAGRFKGKVEQLACPACGSPASYSPGMTSHFICPSCHAQVDVSSSVAVVLATGARVREAPFTVELGASAMIDGTRYTVLGALQRTEQGDANSSWNEYLLYATGRGFIWLIETAEGWQRSDVLDEWPNWPSPEEAIFQGRPFRRFASYTARVTYALGAFNWRVSIGDLAQVAEFRDGQLTLAAEATHEELTWSRSRPLALDQVRAWFGEAIHADRQAHPSYRHTARWILIMLAVINGIPLLFSPSRTLLYVAVACVAIYLPAVLLDRMDSSTS
ncbi:MAG: DUF4178 domain-containing protein [Burkholderiaceae bacterium]